MVFLQTLNMHPDCLIHVLFCFALRIAGCDTPWQIRRIRGEIVANFFDYNQKTVNFSHFFQHN